MKDEIIQAIIEYEEALAEYERVCKPLQEKVNEAKERLMSLLRPDIPVEYNGITYIHRKVQQSRINTRAVREFIQANPEYKDWLRTVEYDRLVRIIGGEMR